MKKLKPIILSLIIVLSCAFDVSGGWYSYDDNLRMINPNWGLDLRENDIIDVCNILPYDTELCDFGSDSLRINEIWLAGASLHIGDSDVESTLSFTTSTDYTYLGDGGLNDFSASGDYSGTSPWIASFLVTIDGVGGTDTFQWTKNGVVQATGVPITGSPQLLSDDIYVTFTATTGHKNKDQWIIYTGYRLRGGTETEIASTLTVRGGTFVEGIIESLGVISNADITHANGDIIIETQVSGDTHAIKYYDENEALKSSITWTDDAGDGELSFDGSADVSFDTDLLFLDYSADEVGIGTTDPKSNLHILTSGTSGLGTTPADRGVIITGEVGQSRLYFENVSSDAGERVFQINNNEGYLRFASLNDTAASFVKQYILCLEHDTGNLGAGTGTPEYPFHVSHASAGYALIETDLNGGDTGLLFRNSVGENGYVKGAVFYKNDLSGFGKGDFHFALEDSSNDSNVDVTDTIVTILHEGYTGFGTYGVVTPAYRTHSYHATEDFLAKFQSGDSKAGILLEDHTSTVGLFNEAGVFSIDTDNSGVGELTVNTSAVGIAVDLNLTGDLTIGTNLTINEAGIEHASATQAFAIDKTGGENLDLAVYDGGLLNFLVDTGGSFEIDTPALNVLSPLIDFDGAVKIHDTQAGDAMRALHIGNDSSSAGSAVQFDMSVQSSDIPKAALIFENTDGDANGRGVLRICRDGIADSNPVSEADEVVRFDDNGTSITGKVGIGTLTIPHGGIGEALLALEGTDTSAADGPHIQITTDADDYPLFQMLNVTHDDISMSFDAYLETATWKSSDAGSNFHIHKLNDKLKFRYDSGVAQGGTVGWNEGFQLDASGNFQIGDGDFSATLDVIGTTELNGDVTIDGDLVVTAADVSITATNDITLDNQNATGGINNVLGTNTSATSFNIKNNSLTNLLTVDGGGDLAVDTDTLYVDASTDSVGINRVPTDSYSLDVSGDVRLKAGGKDVTFESGNYGTATQKNSTDFYFNRNDVGFNQAEFVMYNQNQVYDPFKFFKMDYTNNDAGDQLGNEDSGLKLYYDGSLSIPHWRQDLNKTTGWLYGGQVTINAGDSTLIDVTAGAGIIVDYSDTTTRIPSFEYVSWTAQTGLDPGFTGRSTYVYVETGGTFAYYVNPTPAVRRDGIQLARLLSATGDGVLDFENPAWGQGTAFVDYAKARGSWGIEGNEFTPNNSNLLLDRASGSTYRYHAEDTIGSENVHTESSATGITTYNYHLQGSNTTTVETDIDPDNWDSSGSKTAVTTDYWTIQEVWFFPVSGTTHVLYGQAEYSSKGTAIIGLYEEAKVRNDEILDGAIFRSYYIIQEGSTNFDDAIIIQEPLITKPSLGQGRVPNFINKSYTLGDYGSADENYIAGYYEASTTDVTLTIGGTTTQTFGTANKAEAAHAFVVFNAGGDASLTLTVSGTSITDLGVRTTGDSEVIATGIQLADVYAETSKKWLGQITYTLTGTTGNYDFNYGYAKYEDFGNRDFTVTDFEVVGKSGNTASNLDIELLAHDSEGWTYAATGFQPGGTVICQMSTDYSTDTGQVNEEYFAFKRTNLNSDIEGSGSEGVIVRFTQTTNNAIRYADVHIGVLQ
jgi:hypothetical protein